MAQVFRCSFGRCVLKIGDETIGMWNDRYQAVSNMNDAIIQLDPFQAGQRSALARVSMPDGRTL